MRLRLAALCAVVVATLVGSLPAAASSADQFANPRRYYLSLGDSLAFGYQQAKANVTHDPTAFNTGYTDDFASLLRTLRPNLTTVNFGCPGETTTTFMQGGCPYPSTLLHDPYSGPQLAAAVHFLETHRNQVSPITIDLGSNDTTQALLPICVIPGQASACQVALNNLLMSLNTNLETSVATLHAASPRSEIIVLDLYNPLAVQVPATDAIALAINNTIKAAASAAGARVADVFPAFNPSGPTEVPTLCALTLVCTALQDRHASDAGYLVMAMTLWQASGYQREDD